MLDYMPSFKSFEVIGVNQELSMLTYVMKGCTIMQISSSSDTNIAKVQLSVLKQFLPWFRVILHPIKSIINFFGICYFFATTAVKAM